MILDAASWGVVNVGLWRRIDGPNENSLQPRPAGFCAWRRIPYNASVPQRRSIQQLSPSLVNRIAAGEVIERPASVVKELVENAIDAGAGHIVIEVTDGGRDLIRVIDDGCGIPPGELPLAFASHATSKILGDDDLFRISTMGFRGEALASVASVSQARILSRIAESDAAYEIVSKGGELTATQAAAGNVGTTLEIRNLFFNVPARRKFLKGTATEFGHISEAVLRLSLPFPGVSFKLLHNNRVSLDLPATTAERRLLAAWPEEFHEMRLPIDVRDAEVSLTGIVGLPELARPTPKYQYVYLNGRSIRDRFIGHALKEAYRGLTEPGRQPAAVLLLTVPPGDVDVNVHPTKSEVRFRDSGRIHGMVLAGVRERLLGSDLTPAAAPRREPAVEAIPREPMRQRLADFFRGVMPDANNRPNGPNAINWPSGPNAIDGPNGPDAPNPRGAATASDGSIVGEAASPMSSTPATPWTLRQQMSPQSSFAALMPRPPAIFSPGGDSAAPAPQGFVSPHAAAPDVPPFPEMSAASGVQAPAVSTPLDASSGALDASGGSVQSSKPLPSPARNGSAIQLHNSYLVAESDDGMIIIDQHALHERIMYEDLKSRLARGPLESQHLLIPQTLPASSRQIELLEQIQPLLRRLGVEASAFGPDTVAVQAFPSFLEKLDPAEFLAELLERGEQELLDLHDEELLHGILDMMACKAAVKAGDPLSPAEIEALLARRHLIDRSSNCPHGRPTTLRLSLRDLEKQFKRTGF